MGALLSINVYSRGVRKVLVKEKIVDFLKEMSPERIKEIAKKTTFLRGQEYATQNKIMLFIWDKKSKQKKRLLAYISGTTIYQVAIACTNKKMCVAVCDCPLWTSFNQCKHTVCALLTANQALCDPDNANSNFRMGILGESRTPFDKETVFYIKPDQTNNTLLSPHFFLSVGKNRQQLPKALLDASPNLCKLNKMQYFFRSSQEREEDEVALISALTNELKNSELYVSEQANNYRVDTSNNMVLGAKSQIELNLDGNELIIRRLLASEKYMFSGQIIRISRHIIFIKDEQTLAVVNEEKPWDWVDNYILPNMWRIQYRCGNGGINPESTAWSVSSSQSFSDLAIPFQLPIKCFNETNPIIYIAAGRGAIQGSCTFKVKNQIVTPINVPVDIVVNAEFNADSRTVKVATTAVIHGCATPLFRLIAGYIAGIGRLSNWLKTKKRRQMLIKGLFELLNIHTKKEATNHIKQLIKNLVDSYNNEVNKVELHNYFTRFANELDRALESIFICNNTFYYLPLNFRHVCDVARIIGNFFDEWTVECDVNCLSFFIPKEIFQHRLAEFSNLLQRNNIHLNINNKKLKIISLDFSIDASREVDSDWFKLDPEILSDGIKLTKEQRDALFDADGSIESHDCFKMLDQKSQEIFILLAKIFKQSFEESRFNCDHKIVEIPRLQILTLLDLRKNGVNVKLSNEDEGLIDNLTNFSTIKKVPIPTIFCGELREYQKQAYDWLAFLYMHKFGACVADDMGLGKTIQAIAFLSGIASGTIVSRAQTHIAHLIVVPPTLVFNWIQELHKFCPCLKVQEYTSRFHKLDLNNFDIIITTYDRVRIDIDKLKEIDFHVLILDEAQAIKNIKAGRSSATRQLRSMFTISLTGTPLENHIGEYYSVIDVALPGLLPTYKNFMRQVQSEQGNLIRKTKPFVLRRTKEAILHELPPKIENNIYLNMSEKQQKLYATAVQEVKRLIDRAYKEKTAVKAKIIALTAILRLRQICLSPQIIDAKADLDSPKIDYLVCALDEVIQEKNAALVFSQFTTCLDIVEIQLKKAGIEFLRIDGSTPTQQRKKIVETFQCENSPISVLLLSLKTGGVGLNLTRASYVYHLDPWWNPAVENQASDRAYRIGQKNSVFVNRLVMHHTIEEKMMKLKEEKSRLFNDIMGNAENKIKGIISKKDFDFLLE